VLTLIACPIQPDAPANADDGWHVPRSSKPNGQRQDGGEDGNKSGCCFGFWKS
jgi:hypothetical protein